MAKTDAVDTRKVAFTTATKEENFESLCNGVILSSDADCFVDFDKPADNGGILIKASGQPVYFPLCFTRLNVIGASGSGSLYVAGVRN